MQDLFSADKAKSATADAKRREIKVHLKTTLAKVGALEHLARGDDAAVVERVRRALGQQLTTLTKSFQQTELKEVRQRTERGGALISADTVQVDTTELTVGPMSLRSKNTICWGTNVQFSGGSPRKLGIWLAAAKTNCHDAHFVRGIR